MVWGQLEVPVQWIIDQCMNCASAHREGFILFTNSEDRRHMITMWQYADVCICMPNWKLMLAFANMMWHHILPSVLREGSAERLDGLSYVESAANQTDGCNYSATWFCCVPVSCQNPTDGAIRVLWQMLGYTEVLKFCNFFLIESYAKNTTGCINGWKLNEYATKQKPRQKYRQVGLPWHG